MNGNGAQLSTSSPIIGRSPAMRRALGLVERFAPTDIPILLVGETGTGKDLLAQEIHRLSGREGEFVDVNCGALPRDLVEGELFGHRRGAFTGATRDRRGLVTAADRGTLFLDEVVSLPPDGQAKLLRVLETHEVRRLGESHKERVDIRVVAAAQEGVLAQMKKGAFRRDLYQRLAGIVIELPPLRTRDNDVVEIAAHLLADTGHVLGESAPAVLRSHSWGGNVRELAWVLRRVVCLTAGGKVEGTALLEAIALGSSWDSPAGLQHTPAARADDRSALVGLARRFRGNAVAIGNHLGVSRATVYRRAKALGVTIGVVAATEPGKT